MKFITALIAAATITTRGVASAFAPAATSMNQARSLSTTQLDMAATIQFVRGLDEKVVPNVKLTRARDGSSGVATFQFVSPNVFDASTQAMGEITGMFMEDDEGEISTTE